MIRVDKVQRQYVQKQLSVHVWVATNAGTHRSLGLVRLTTTHFSKADFTQISKLYCPMKYQI